jgi:hypothetical protein
VAVESEIDPATPRGFVPRTEIIRTIRRNSLGFPLAISSSRIIYFLQSIPQNASISGNPFLSPKVVESRMDSRKIS